MNVSLMPQMIGHVTNDRQGAINLIARNDRGQLMGKWERPETPFQIRFQALDFRFRKTVRPADQNSKFPDSGIKKFLESRGQIFGSKRNGIRTRTADPKLCSLLPDFSMSWP